MEIYFEETINFNTKLPLYTMAAYLCGRNENYCLYENGSQISIGIGEYIKVSVTAHKIIIKKKASHTEELPYSNFSKDLEKVLRDITIKGWRAYGIAYFGLAGFVYGIEAGKEKEELLHLFIPEVEYRISNGRILLRAISQEKLLTQKEAVNELLENLENKRKTSQYLNPKEILLHDEEYYKKIVEAGVREIQGGKYQKVILSRRIPLQKRLNMMETFINGREANTPARSYMCCFNGLEVVGFSPETVAEVDSNRTVYTYPLAGTRALTSDMEKNKELRMELYNDSKEIAEHAISVKLADDELLQVCEAGTVMVSEFMSILERGTVQHLGSRLKGILKEGCNSWDAFCKLFPAVTASGIPKREAIEAIGRIEKEGRELYSGSVLLYDFDGTLDAALVLRSVFQTPASTWTRVGAGIVEMSRPEREYEETCEKVSSVARHLVAEI